MACRLTPEVANQRDAKVGAIGKRPYTRSYHKRLYECPTCGVEFTRRPTDVWRGQIGCYECGVARRAKHHALTPQQAQQNDDAIGAFPLSPYVGSKTPRRYRCIDCQNPFMANPNVVWTHKQLRCGACGRKQAGRTNTLSLQEVDNILRRNGFQRHPDAIFVHTKHPIQIICHCGRTFSTTIDQTRRIQSCGNCDDPKVGDKFGSLTVTKVMSSGSGCSVMVRCDCGRTCGPYRAHVLKIGNTKTCGQCNNPQIGDRFGSLTITQILLPHNGARGCQVQALCDCGTPWTGPNSLLQAGQVKSCGHCNDPQVGDKFGLLTVVDTTVLHSCGCTTRATCECGGTWTGPGYRLYSGTVSSCGCVTSAGERVIKNILDTLHVPYTHDRSISPECRDRGTLRFDFILELHGQKICIEYQGQQHYRPVEYFGGIEAFKSLQIRDQIKRDYCAANGITLYEIPYTYFDQLEELITELIETGVLRKLKHPKVQNGL